MKIQCACGAKYVLDIQPGAQAVQFVCPACGRDYSDYLNEMLRSQQAQSPAAPVAPPRTENISIPPAKPKIAISHSPPPASSQQPPPQHLVPPVPTESRLKIGR